VPAVAVLIGSGSDHRSGDPPEQDKVNVTRKIRPKKNLTLKPNRCLKRELAYRHGFSLG
jgi:hypothetical protein